MSYALYAALLFVVMSITVFKRRQILQNPPGPRAIPVIGNILDIPLDRPWETYRDWCKEYGAICEVAVGLPPLIVSRHLSASDVVFVRLPLQSITILGSYQAAEDLLVKRSDIYADRPQSVMLELYDLHLYRPLHDSSLEM